MRSFHPVILTLLASCTWVSDDEVDARRAEMDDDLDGYPVSEDCNDRDPEISPAAEEVWYNGIDDNCDGQDDFDADGDGYVLDEYVGYTTNGLEGSGALAGGMCGPWGEGNLKDGGCPACFNFKFGF